MIRIKNLINKKPEPDFNDLLNVVSGEKNLDRAHFIELFIDEEIKKYIIENYFKEQNFSLAKVDSDKNDIFKILNSKEYLKKKDNYYRQLINFYLKMGYSCIVDWKFWLDLREFFKTAYLVGKDPQTSIFPREERIWVQEGKGLIQNWKDFEKFPWNIFNNLLEVYINHLSEIEKYFIDGFKVIVPGSIMEQVMEWIMGYEGVLYNIFDNPELVSAVFIKMGEAVHKLYSSVIHIKILGAIWHCDDLGFKTSTILNPCFLRKTLFPWLKKFSNLAHSNNKQIFYHVCGFKDEIIEDLIDDIKFDAIHSFEDNCCPIKEYKEKYGNRIGLLGGVDMDKLTRYTEVDLRNYIKDILNFCISGGKYIFGSGNTISNYIPVNNYFILLEEGYRYFD